MGGRGSGKSTTWTRAILEFLFGRQWYADPKGALVGPTLESVRLDMVERTLLPLLPPWSIVTWRRTTVDLLIRLAPTPGAKVAHLKGYSSETPGRLRGPNLHFAACDEIAVWKDADRSPQAVDTTWSNLVLAVREQDRSWRPRIVCATTPRAVRLLRNHDDGTERNPGPGLHDSPLTVVSTMSTMDNLHNLAPDFYETSIAPLEGTRLYSQEVDGNLIEAVAGALWSPEQVDDMVDAAMTPETLKELGVIEVVVGVDPAVGGGTTGIVVCYLAADGVVWVVEDCSTSGDSTVWGPEVIKAARRHGAHRVIPELNQGHDLVIKVLQAESASLFRVPIQGVWAKEGKTVRAEPVANLSRRGRVRFCGTAGFSQLWSQMRQWTGAGESPDRLDAMVYSILSLLPVDTGAGSLFSVVSPAARPV